MDGVYVRRALAALERERRIHLRRTLPWVFGVGLATLGAATFMFVTGRGWPYLTLFFGGALAFGLYGAHLGRMAAAFKLDLMPQIMARVHPGLERYDAEGLPQEQFEAAGVFDKTPDSYASRDLFAGLIGSTAVAFAMVQAKKENAWRKDRDPDVLFEGLFFIADFNKHFNGRTHLRAGGAGLVASLREAHVKLEHPRFGRTFTATSTDQIEARYILTPDLAERLLALKAAFSSVDVVFVDSCIAVALGAPFHLLEPLVMDGIDARDFDELVAKLQGVVGLVEELNLNTRIWSKKPVG